MGWSFRKSINLGGGLRLNLSNRGMGVSAGLKGFRAGVGPGGRTYVQCGSNGIYYRKSWGGGAAAVPASPTAPRPTPVTRPVPRYTNPTIPNNTLGTTRVIESGDVAGMVDSSARALLTEIAEKHRKFRLHRWFLLPTFLAVGGGIASGLPALVVAAVFSAVVGTPILWIVDRRRKLVDLYYELDGAYSQRYRAVLEAFEQLRRSKRIWLVETETEVIDRKYHAGAGSLMNRQVVEPAFVFPPFFKSNVQPPMLPAGRQTMYFLPDFVLVIDGGRVGAIGYPRLTVDASKTNFIESESVPRDSRQVGQTWRYVNKGGGPDKRFRDNRQLPVMEYGQVWFRSATGLNELFHASHADTVFTVASAISGLAYIGASAGAAV